MMTEDRLLARFSGGSTLADDRKNVVFDSKGACRMAEQATPVPRSVIDAGRGEEDYLPGMGRHALLPLYDPLTRMLGLRKAHAELADGADLRDGQRVLEIGCGTANLALLVKRRHPGVEVVGLDPDPQALARAQRKARRRHLALQLDQGHAERLPYPDAAFERVLSAFMFHHLEPADREATLHEVARVLRPGGSIRLLDFGGARDPGDGRLARMAQRNERLRDNYDDRIPALMRDAGLIDARELHHRVTRLGRITCWTASRPAG
jgi:ubiquinone/menaquinone biosynthesis C-methylase UbiE